MISVAVLSPRQDATTVDRIANDEPSVRRLVAQFPNRRRVGCANSDMASELPVRSVMVG
jgi:hypothetical protein